VEDEDGKEERRRGGIKKKKVAAITAGQYRPGIALCSDNVLQEQETGKIRPWNFAPWQIVG
jgi:hypothetical protein